MWVPFLGALKKPPRRLSLGMWSRKQKHASERELAAGRVPRGPDADRERLKWRSWHARGCLQRPVPRNVYSEFKRKPDV